jgi:hypothetical protein
MSMLMIRSWQGGTPNLSEHIRAIPAAFFSAPWYNPYQPKRDGWATVSHNRMIPPSVFRTLSPEGQAAAAEFASESEEEVVCEWHPRFAAQDQEQAAALLNGEEPLPKL